MFEVASAESDALQLLITAKLVAFILIAGELARVKLALPRQWVRATILAVEEAALQVCERFIFGLLLDHILRNLLDNGRQKKPILHFKRASQLLDSPDEVHAVDLSCSISKHIVLSRLLFRAAYSQFW